MAFEHPLARKARVFPFTSPDGREAQILVVATTVPLDPKDERYRKSLVERLSEAARDYVTQSNEATWFVLIAGKPNWKKLEPDAAQTALQIGRKVEEGPGGARRKKFGHARIATS
jgi:hypothetical protein